MKTDVLKQDAGFIIQNMAKEAEIQHYRAFAHYIFITKILQNNNMMFIFCLFFLARIRIQGLETNAEMC